MTDAALDALLNIAALVTILVVVSPVRAKAVVSRLAAGRAKLHNLVDARLMHLQLRGRGTCLSRALAVAARCSDAKVVIAIDSTTVGAARANQLRAHAWVEVYGGMVGEDSSNGWSVLARL